MKGTYLILIKLIKPITIKVGAQGMIPFNQGFYIYIGSAMGEKGSTTLLNRVKRHVRKRTQKSVHWHIDYLLDSKFSHIVQLFLIPSKERLECYLASRLRESAEDFIPKFGCSDCSCKSHLFYYSSNGGLKTFFTEQDST